MSEGKTYRRIKDSYFEDMGIIVKDMNSVERRMERIQAKIDAAEMLDIGTTEYEQRAARPVHLEKAEMICSEDDKTQVAIHTIQQSKSKEGNLRVRIGLDVWQKKEVEQYE